MEQVNLKNAEKMRDIYTDFPRYIKYYELESIYPNRISHSTFASTSCISL